MKGPPFALLLILWISPALSEESDSDLAPGPNRDPACHLLLILLRGGCTEECLSDACSYLQDRCSWKLDCELNLPQCRSFASACLREWYKSNGGLAPPKKSSEVGRSFLFMKLHPLLNRNPQPEVMNVPLRLRRIGGRFGTEFLGKRSGVGDRRRGRRVPGTELLGKRREEEPMVKKNVELLGKRMAQLLGKRGVEFLGKRANPREEGPEGKRSDWLTPMGIRTNSELSTSYRLIGAP